jgi:hypothetical protein
MSNGSSAFIIPTSDDDLPENLPNTPELADWELVTPFGTIKVGPGQKWEWEERKAL